MGRDDKDQQIYTSKKDHHGRRVGVEKSIGSAYALYITSGGYERERDAGDVHKIAAYVTKEDAIALRDLLIRLYPLDGAEVDDFEEMVAKYR